MLLNCGVGEDSWESLGLQGDPTSQSWKKSTLNIHWKDCCWSWSSNTLATWCKEPNSPEKTQCQGRVRARGERGNREDGGMASLTQWTCVWANSRREWKTGKPGVLQSIGSQRVSHDWATEQQQLSLTILWYGWNNVTTDYGGKKKLRLHNIDFRKIGNEGAGRKMQIFWVYTLSLCKLSN